MTSREITTQLIKVSRTKNTDSGNPGYRLETDKGEFRVDGDSQCSYSVNPEHEGQAVNLTLSGKRVIAYELSQ